MIQYFELYIIHMETMFQFLFLYFPSKHIMCSNKCIASILLSTNSCDRFNQSFDILSKRIKKGKDIYIQNFYKSLYQEGILKCDIGVAYLEKYIFTTFYKYLFVPENEHRNRFINNKLFLYNWLEFRHLDLTFDNENPFLELCSELNFYDQIDSVICVFKKIQSCKTPTDLLNSFLFTITSIHKVIGVGASHDELFPILVFILVRSQVKDIDVIYECIVKYRKGAFESCEDGCSHLIYLKPETVCECIIGVGHDDKEIDYYLTIFQAAIVFIERMEYDSINITKHEYDANITINIDKIEAVKGNVSAKISTKKMNRLYKYLNGFLQ